MQFEISRSQASVLQMQTLVESFPVINKLEVGSLSSIMIIFKRASHKIYLLFILKLVFKTLYWHEYYLVKSSDVEWVFECFCCYKKKEVEGQIYYEWQCQKNVFFFIWKVVSAIWWRMSSLIIYLLFDFYLLLHNKGYSWRYVLHTSWS